MAVTKATKKFEKKHLKGVLEKRKATAKIKQRAQVKAKKQTKRTQDAEFYKGDKEEAAPSRKRRPDAKVSGMSVDDFFQGGFQILDDAAKTTEDTHLGKRKRNGAAAKDDSDSDSDSEDGLQDAGSEDDELEDVDADAGMSKEAMDALVQDDPDFYQFLKENDSRTLEFDEDAGADLGDEEEEDAEDAGDRPAKKQKKAGKKGKEDDEEDDEPTADNELTMDMVAKWETLMKETHSQRAAHQTLVAFRCAVHLDEEEEGGGSSTAERYTIKDHKVYSTLLVVALTHIPSVVRHHLPVKVSEATGRVTVPSNSKKAKTLSPMVKSFATSVLHLLTEVLTEDDTIQAAMKPLPLLLPYLMSFRKLLKSLVRTVVNFWAQPTRAAETRDAAFLVMRVLMVIGDAGVRELVLKETYRGLTEGCRANNANTIDGIRQMKASAAELWGIDTATGYTTAFASLRQLAILLRTTIVKSQHDSFRTIYNWQYLHSLDFWSLVLSTNCSLAEVAEAYQKGEGGGAAVKNPLCRLVYPVVQLTLGVIGLRRTAMYFPMQFHLIRSMLRLMKASGRFIPLAGPLLLMLQSAEMKNTAKPSTANELDFALAYKAPKSLLHTTVYQTAVGEQIVELLSEYFALSSTSIAFPEMALPVNIMLKRWIKEVRKRNHGRNTKVIAGLAILVQKLEANAKFIEDKRATVDFAPRDRAKVKAFAEALDWEKTPIGAFVARQRKVNEERRRVQEASRKEEAKQQEEEKKEKLEARKQEFAATGAEEEEEEEEEEEDEEEDEEEEEEEEEDDDEDEDDEE